MPWRERITINGMPCDIQYSEYMAGALENGHITSDLTRKAVADLIKDLAKRLDAAEDLTTTVLRDTGLPLVGYELELYRKAFE